MKKADFIELAERLKNSGFDFVADFSQLSPSKVHALELAASVYNFRGKTPVSTDRELYEKLARLVNSTDTQNNSAPIKTMQIKSTLFFVFLEDGAKSFGFVEINKYDGLYSFGTISKFGYTYMQGSFNDFLAYFGFDAFGESIPINDYIEDAKGTFIDMMNLIV